MDLGFRGEVVDFYHRYRRGYPPAVLDALVGAFGLGEDDVVADLGCGTGQLTLPMARRVRAVAGVDPEPAMLERARRAASDEGVSNVSWVLASDAEVPALAGLLGSRALGAVTIGQALHWMDHERLFPALAPLLRPGGGVAVVANGTPLWLQDTAWSRALRPFLEDWLGTRLVRTCGTDDESRRRYADALTRSGYAVHHTDVAYEAALSADEIVGGVYSALPVDRLPAPGERAAFAADVERVLAPCAPFTEQVQVSLLLGLVPRPPPVRA
ncbi:class I SAM-dependent methyltransferase [Prauserella cavernicola]|uniref:Methyltransferase domain-containing protein n=1 Tax=Prauserella cavernicola TaxID=2800127 RepID=A0A934QNN5_9PSEU|nr:methyltransferase domain-containing protein [Prauserella cavernicola]MBK1783183.1 methyltransferase domain-containing protein [Prauserella cavernicola]